MNRDSVEYLSREQWSQWHTELLQSTVNRAFTRVPFYKERMMQVGLSPDNIGSVEDISRLPFTTRDDLSDNYPYGLFSVPLRDIVRIHALRSGHANPVARGLTAQDLRKRTELTARFFKTSGVGADDIVQICLDPGMALHGQDLKEGAENLGALVIPPDPVSTFTRLRIMADFKTTVLVTTPSYGRHLLEIFREKNMPLAALNLKTVILIGETLTDETRMVFEKELDVETRAAYGIFEASGPSMAYECHCKCGLHIAMDHVIPEVVDPETGEKVPDGQPGELVITTVTARANPLIRFRTGDVTSINKETCNCGRTTWRMSPVEARCDNLLTVRGVKISAGQMKKLISDRTGGSELPFLIVLHKWKHLTQIEILIAIDETIFTGSLPQLHRWIRQSEEIFQEAIGISCRIRPVEFDSIEPCLQKGKFAVEEGSFEAGCRG